MTSDMSEYRLGLNTAAGRVKEAFEALPSTADNATKDLLLDLYNDIVKESNAD